MDEVMEDNKKKADKSPPLNFDEITNSLSMAVAQINNQQSDILSLAARVAELECRCSRFGQLNK